MSELISVIVPVYKVEKYLRRCLNSIINQTFENLEIILVNDGSPDLCGDICEEYASLDPRVVVLHQENQGLSGARNSGISVSQGDYIAFVDSDDWLDFRYFEILYKNIVTTDSDISVCNYLKTYDENEVISQYSYEVIELTNLEALNYLNSTYYVQLVTAWGKLFKKEILGDITFPEGKLHEDEFVAHKLIFNASKIVLSTQQLYMYWQRHDSITGKSDSLKNKLDVIDALYERADFYNYHNLINLRNLTYKKIFFNYLHLLSIIEKLNNKKLYNLKKSELNNLKQNLRDGDHNFKFKLFYESYFIAPALMKLTLSLHKNNKTSI